MGDERPRVRLTPVPGYGQNEDVKRVTLTFDNGPTPVVTDRVLATLAAHGVSAVFFVIGQRAATYEGRVRVRDAVAAGHRVGNHTWTHSVPFGELDDASVRYEIDDTVRLVNALGGDGLLFRPYGVGGVLDHRLMSPFGSHHLQSIGATVVSWTSVPGDWLDPVGWVETALADVDTQQWPVVVLHDVEGAAADRLDDFLVALRERGVEFRQDFPAECVHIDAGVPTAAYGALQTDVDAPHG